MAGGAGGDHVEEHGQARRRGSLPCRHHLRHWQPHGQRGEEAGPGFGDVSEAGSFMDGGIVDLVDIYD